MSRRDYEFMMDRLVIRFKSIFVIVRKNLLNIIKASFFQFVGITFIISFLLFFLNILMGLSHMTTGFSREINDKLGVFFYIKQDPQKESEVYSKIINLKEELENKSIKVEYYSPEEAFKNLQNRIPNVLENFKKYNIANPLPPTLYVIFKNQQQYEVMKSSVEKYKDIIQNYNETNLQGKSFSEQQKLVSDVINLTNFLTSFSYFLITVLVVIIITFLLFIIKINFYNFYKQIEIEKLLGASYLQIKLPFLSQILITLISGSVLMGMYFNLFLNYLNKYFSQWNFDVFSFLAQYKSLISNTIIIEFSAIILLSLIMGNFFLNRLIRKV